MRRHRAAFTLLELTITLVTIAILVTLLLPFLASVRKRAQRVICIANLRSLHVAAQEYIQDNNQWPQIRVNSSTDTTGTVYAQKWIAALAPYQIQAKTWICPTVENLRGNPDYTAVGKERIDYYGMPFDDKPLTPHQWPRSPWFFETNDVHGNGQLIIFTDGSVAELKSLIPAGPHLLSSP